MEVHHHAHHGHGKKTWKSYFWEFAMLFLAVFCGSLAEYQLEHKIEADREKAYIRSMLTDLATDTANLRTSMAYFDRQNRFFDTIYTHFDQLTLGYHAPLRQAMDSVVGYRDFFANDKTLQQLKNSGGLRLIRKQEAADGIAAYDAKLKEYQKSLDDLGAVFFKMYDVQMDMTNMRQLDLDRSELRTASAAAPITENYLLKQDPQTLGSYYNRLKRYQRQRQSVYRRMQMLHEQATQLMEILQRHYKL